MNNLVANHNEGLGPNGQFRANTPRKACLPKGGAKGSDDSCDGDGAMKLHQSDETEGSMDRWNSSRKRGENE
jgi:hypothetical protein